MKRNALLVGGFVLLAVAIAIGAILWLSGSGLLHKQQRAVIFFQGSVTGLYVGAPVTFRGVPVGLVESIGIEVDSRSLLARIPVRVRLQQNNVRYSEKDSEPDFEQLVQRGLRARLVAQSFVTGQKTIELDFVPDSPVRLVGGTSDPEIPALADRFGALIDQVAELPLQQTVDDLRHTLVALQRTLDTTQTTLATAATELSSVGSEARKTMATATHTLDVATTALQQVQRSADGTLASVTRLADDARGTLTGLQPDLQQTLAGARRAADAAQVAMGRVSEMTAPGGTLRGDLDTAVRDLSQAARGLRAWSELLEEKPNAVIFGSDR